MSLVSLSTLGQRVTLALPNLFFSSHSCSGGSGGGDGMRSRDGGGVDGDVGEASQLTLVSSVPASVHMCTGTPARVHPPAAGASLDGGEGDLGGGAPAESHSGLVSSPSGLLLARCTGGGGVSEGERGWGGSNRVAVFQLTLVRLYYALWRLLRDIKNNCDDVSLCFFVFVFLFCFLFLFFFFPSFSPSFIEHTLFVLRTSFQVQ